MPSTAPITATQVTAPELPDLMDSLPPTVKALSLDCFDTLFWRKVARPTDVFFALQQSPLWVAAGITAQLRAKAEVLARRRRHLTSGTHEVSIEDIYRALLRKDDAADVSPWVSAEIEAETAHGFIYAPVLALIRRARARGLRVFIVSDIYYSAQQLGTLLRSVMGEDFSLIDRVHCSSDHGLGKSQGLFERVLRREKLAPQQVLHLGDNPEADFHGPTRLGLHARHLVNLPEALLPLLDAREQAATQLMPEVREACGLPSAYHALWAMHGHGLDGAARKIGYFALGPIFHAFSVFLRDRLARLAEGGRPVKYAFLLRDGHLPALAFAHFSGLPECPQINVSRLTAAAAALRSRNDVLQFLAKSVGPTNLEAVMAQLMLPPETAKAILEKAYQDRVPERAFCSQVMRDDNLRKVFRASRQIRERLYEHVRRQTGVAPGDTLALIDLGYSGTVQTSLSTVFRDEFDVELHGIYLISSRASAQQTDRCGLVGPDWADERLIVTLTAYIGTFEMMCTKAQASVVDYAEDGEPVLGAVGTKGQQSEVVRQMQAACLQFVADAQALPAGCQPTLTLRERAQQVVADLGRLLYLPDREEIACLTGFEFDVNQGSDLVLSLADMRAGMSEFRRHGMAMIHQQLDQMRIGYPMELRYMDLTLSTTLIAAHRCGFGVKPALASYRLESIPVLYANASSHWQVETEARAGHDGYFVMNLVLNSSLSTAVLWGRRHEWLQIDSVEKVLLTNDRDRQSLSLDSDVIFDGMQTLAGGLMRCSEQGLMLIAPCTPSDDRRYRIQVVFRPIAARASVPVPETRPLPPAAQRGMASGD